MALPENVEKIRQGIMRFRELLDIMQHRLEHGERAYAKLFPEHVSKDLPEKEQQTQVAYAILDDPSALGRAALDMQFYSRELERAFEELYNNVMYRDISDAG